MVVGLFALSLVMIVGGIASVVQGFPYVRLESGLAMVISGATAASAGVILLGLSAVVQQLRRVEASFRSAGTGQAPTFPESTATIPVAPPSLAPSLEGAAGLAGISLEAFEPALDRPARPSVGSEAPSPRSEASVPSEAEPAPPDLLPPEPASTRPPPAPPAEAPEPPPPVSVEDDLFVDPEPVVPKAREAVKAPEELKLRPSLDDAKEEAIVGAKPAEPAPAEKPASETKPDARQVVGTYSSGGNTYVMYADGIIEAETPRGRFTFNSLDELKAFVAAGGENDARGAA